MYSKIILCIKEKEDEVLAKQIAMLKERHKAEVEHMDAEVAREMLESIPAAEGDGQAQSGGASTALFISDNEELLVLAQSKGIATNDPQKMRDSYMKAMEMLKAMGLPNGGQTTN